MYCRKCGSKISQQAQFCDYCGTEVIYMPQKSYAEKTPGQDHHPGHHNGLRHQPHGILLSFQGHLRYISASLFASFISLVCAVFPWNLIGEGIGTSLPMRIMVIAFALLGDYHATKAKQVNHYIKNKYGFEIQVNAMKLGYYLSVVMTIIGLFALFMYGA